MNCHLKCRFRTVRLMAGATFILVFLLGSPGGVFRLNAQPISWDFENGNDHGFTLFSLNPADPAPDDPETAGDESLTGVGGPNGLPEAGLTWTIGPPDQFDGFFAAVEEGCHIETPDGRLQYSDCNDPWDAAVGEPPFDFTNERGQLSFLNTYNLSQWGDDLHTEDNDQIARSPEVTLEPNSVLLSWVYGGGSGDIHAPELDSPGQGYTTGSSGIAVRSATDESLLASVSALGAEGAPIDMLTLDLSEFEGQTVFVDVVDAFSGGWGWISVDEIRIGTLETDFDPDNFTFEAEDFNFDGGDFFDDPVLCNTIGGAPDCYFDRVGSQGIDKNEIDMEITVEDLADVYRFGPGFDREEFMDTRITSDLLVRQQYEDADIPDYELRLGEGEWVNYSRTFPAGTFNLFARVPIGVPFGAGTLARVDLVDDATGEDQNLTTLGWLTPDTEGMEGLYGRAVLTDSTGTTPAVLSFDGTPKTLRVTALADGYVAQFYEFDPTTDPQTHIPDVAITSPAEGDILDRGVEVTITATATATGDGAINGVEFFAGGDSIGVDNEGPDYSIAYTPTSSEIDVTLRAVATNDAGVTGEDQVNVELTGGVVVAWDFENGDDEGFTFFSINEVDPASDDPDTAGAESLTGVGGPNGLPEAGLAWTVGPPNQFDGLQPAVVEGNHVGGDGLLDYTLNGQPIDVVNERGQSSYLNTYNLNQWGDGLHVQSNDQIARSPTVELQTNAELTVWTYGGGSGTQAPELDPTPDAGYTDGSSGVAVRSAADESLLGSFSVAGAEGDLTPFTLDLSAFAGQTVVVEVVDAFEGGWGWLAVDEVRISNAVEADGAPVGLGADAAYSLNTSTVVAGAPDSGFTSLDGTWSHDNGSDEWDGSAIGEGNPGGISPLDGYLRIQETGDPRDHGFDDPGSNRKIYLGRDIDPDGASANVLDEGATLFFRARLATDGVLDQLHPDGGGAIADVPATGDGYVIHNGGKGNIGIKQSAGGLISFSLSTVEENGVASGLLMNSLNGASVSDDVDTGDGTANLLELDPTVWHDFWVTIQADASGEGTHRVDISVDGGPAQTVIVTAGDGSDFDGISYLALGVGSTGESGAFDLAAFQFAPGVITPPSAGPEISIRVEADGSIVLTWEGVLLEADNVEGPYTEVEGATSPMTVTPDQAQRYFQSQSSN